MRTREILFLYIILVLSISLLLLVTLYVNSKFNETIINFGKLNEENQAIAHINDFNAGIIKMGTSARAYTVYRKPYDLSDFQQAYNDSKTKLGEFHDIVAGDPVQVKLLDSIEPLINLRYELLNHLLVLKSDSAEAENANLTVKTAAIVRNIMVLTEKLKRNESKTLESYIDITEKGIKTTGGLLLGITAFCISLILFCAYKLNTEIKRSSGTQVQLQSKVEELNRLNEDLERFAYVASHDLLEPVRKLNAFSGLLIDSEKGNLSPAGLDIINRMQNFSLRMQKLIDDLLKYSLGFKKTDMNQVDLNLILEEVKQDLAINILQSGATVKADKLPVITASDFQLRQLFQNIIANSLRYARTGVIPEITISASLVLGGNIEGNRVENSKKQYCKLVFSDNGIGFDNQYAEKIFLIFQRLHGKSEYEGTGIGLSTCKRVVENHGGYIRALGRPGIGADFTIYLPTG